MSNTRVSTSLESILIGGSLNCEGVCGRRSREDGRQSGKMRDIRYNRGGCGAMNRPCGGGHEWIYVIKVWASKRLRREARWRNIAPQTTPENGRRNNGEVCARGEKRMIKWGEGDNG